MFGMFYKYKNIDRRTGDRRHENASEITERKNGCNSILALAPAPAKDRLHTCASLCAHSARCPHCRSRNERTLVLHLVNLCMRTLPIPTVQPNEALTLYSGDIHRRFLMYLLFKSLAASFSLWFPFLLFVCLFGCFIPSLSSSLCSLFSRFAIESKTMHFSVKMLWFSFLCSREPSK